MDLHRVERSIREIAAADLPRVKDFSTGEERAATEQELADKDIFPLGGDFYACCELHDGVVVEGPNGTPRRAYRPRNAPLPGAVLSVGDVMGRYARLPADKRKHVLRADVYRALAG